MDPIETALLQKVGTLSKTKMKIQEFDIPLQPIIEYTTTTRNVQIFKLYLLFITFLFWKYLLILNLVPSTCSKKDRTIATIDRKSCGILKCSLEHSTGPSIYPRTFCHFESGHADSSLDIEA